MKTKQVKKGTELSVGGTFSDLAKKGQEGIPGMLEIVKQKIKELTKGAKEEESTKGKRLPGFTEISSIDKVTILVQADSSVRGKAKAYAESAIILNVNTKKFPFKIEGCSADQWLGDIERAIVLLTNKVELQKLQETQKILEERLSEDSKLQNALEKIANQWADDSAME